MEKECKCPSRKRLMYEKDGLLIHEKCGGKMGTLKGKDWSITSYA